MRNLKGPVQRLCQACLDLVAAWWRTDRVRISPREGELLRMQPGCLFAVNGMPVEVRQKRGVDGPGGASIRYECQTERGPARLDVRFVEESPRVDLFWSASGRMEVLRAHQIEVFG